MRIGDRQGIILEEIGRRGWITVKRAKVLWINPYAEDIEAELKEQGAYWNKVLSRAVDETLATLVKRKKIVRISRGVYARSRPTYAAAVLADPEKVAKLTDEEIGNLRGMRAERPERLILVADEPKPTTQRDLFE